MFLIHLDKTDLPRLIQHKYRYKYTFTFADFKRKVCFGGISSTESVEMDTVIDLSRTNKSYYMPHKL